MKNGNTSISQKHILQFPRQYVISSEKVSLKSSFSDSSVQAIEKDVPFTNSLPDLSSFNSPCNNHLMEKTLELLQLSPKGSENSAHDDLLPSKFYSCSEHDYIKELSSVSNDFGANSNNDVCYKDSKKTEKKVPEKKKVRFADDFGHKLHITMTYDSDEELVLHNVPAAECIASGTSTILSWTKEFENPKKDYLTFFNKLNAQSVLLETLDIDDTFCVAFIMVKNIEPEKTVSLRVTYDNWTSNIDIPAFFSPSEFPSPYDKFKCTLAIPDDPKCDSIEFAILYRCSGKEFWDNNMGKNYKLRKTNSSSAKVNYPSSSYSEPSLVCPPGMRYDDHMYPNFDFYKGKYDMYSSWNHFSDEDRYY